MNDTQRTQRNQKLEDAGWIIDYKAKTLKYMGLYYPWILVDSNCPHSEFEKVVMFCVDYKHEPFKQFLLNTDMNEITFILPAKRNMGVENE